ncbi:uncharacterized protein MYCGRDRAFT_104853 [Zymoseptoria tritici IPO323]|uniref:Complex III subunit 9 n=1 Tax=Zymoseptoria tritici (strain CBS 115943 / IPO323) TaxID=336722 RepID=F9XDA0_ZYMTI|nr:uncharacterized protein MYCGRDRAFT_104853 [Zymoseptoria tritici IPO323]EGP86454.1 hypothetical protein MYCGRDRAFT_104853 [Zymoseptoria tritici IPO323]
MAGILGGVYNALVKRNAVFLSVIFAGTYATSLAFDTGANLVWDQINRGRQWKDIKKRYIEADDE